MSSAMVARVRGAEEKVWLKSGCAALPNYSYGFCLVWHEGHVLPFLLLCACVCLPASKSERERVDNAVVEKSEVRSV
jgi:hypothetical protein